MNGANWLSESKEISNPYLGQSMPTCGTVKEELNYSLPGIKRASCKNLYPAYRLVDGLTHQEGKRRTQFQRI